MRIIGKINLILDWDKNFSLVSIVPALNVTPAKEKHVFYSHSGGVEYMAMMPKPLISQIIANSTKQTDFYLYSYYGEKEQYTLSIVGAERFVLFLQLMRMPQIGPKLASLIASVFEHVKDFYSVIEQNDIKTLTKVPGLGSKKASLIIWHFGKEQGKELIKLLNMQQTLTDYMGINNDIMNKLIFALNSLGVAKQQAKALIQAKKDIIVKEIQENKGDSENIGNLLKIILNSND